MEEIAASEDMLKASGPFSDTQEVNPVEQSEGKEKEQQFIDSMAGLGKDMSEVATSIGLEKGESRDLEDEGGNKISFSKNKDGMLSFYVRAAEGQDLFDDVAMKYNELGEGGERVQRDYDIKGVQFDAWGKTKSGGDHTQAGRLAFNVFDQSRPDLGEENVSFSYRMKTDRATSEEIGYRFEGEPDLDEDKDPTKFEKIVDEMKSKLNSVLESELNQA